MVRQARLADENLGLQKFQNPVTWLPMYIFIVGIDNGVEIDTWLDFGEIIIIRLFSGYDFA